MNGILRGLKCKKQMFNCICPSFYITYLFRSFVFLNKSKMKTLFAAILLSAMSFGAFAQQIATAQATTQVTAVQQAASAHAAKATDSYRCPVCGYTSAKAGDCTKDKVT